MAELPFRRSPPFEIPTTAMLYAQEVFPSLRARFVANLNNSRPFTYPAEGGPLTCGGVSLETLARRFDTPLYVYSADQILERLRLFQTAFAGRGHLVCLCGEGQFCVGDSEVACGSGRLRHRLGGELQRILAAAPEAVERVVFRE